MKKSKIILADQSIVILKGIIAILSDIGSFNIIQKSTNWENIIRAVNKNKPDFLIINHNLLPKTQKYNLSSLFNTNIKTQIIIIYNENLPDFIKAQCLLAIELNEQENVLKNLLKQVLVNPEKKEAKLSSNLSDREKTVVRCIALGMTNKEIADHLFLSAHTIIAHRKNITKKLGIKTVSGLTVYAILNNLVKFEEIEQF